MKDYQPFGPGATPDDAHISWYMACKREIVRKPEDDYEEVSLLRVAMTTVVICFVALVIVGGVVLAVALIAWVTG